MRSRTRIPSRRMPAVVKRPSGLGCKMIVAAILGGLVWVIVTYPAVLVIVAILVVLGCLAAIEDNRRARRLAIKRACESICTFVRGFDYRTIDTWIIRAVFEEIRENRFAIRADDRLMEDLRIDSDDLDEIAEAVAERTGRPLENVEENPMFEKVRTVRQLV